MRHNGPFIAYLGAVIILFGSISYFGWTRTWSALFVPTMSPAFGDMRIIQGAVISARKGLNPQIDNAGDVLQRQLNYPSVWVKIGEAVNLPDESRFMLVCSVIVLGFVGLCAFQLYRFPSLGLLFATLSTAPLLGIERGNTDLIIFCLVFLFSILLPRRWSPICLLIATALKLYPVFALSCLFIRRQFLLFFCSLIPAAAIFVWLQFEISIIRSATPESQFFSYGFPSLLKFFETNHVPRLAFAGLVAAVCTATLSLVLCLRKWQCDRFHADLAFNLFLSGASIYVGTFFFSSNYDYRLVFLLLCVPSLQTNSVPFGRVLLVLVILAMNQTVLRPVLGQVGFDLAWVGKLGLFIAFSAYLMALTIAGFEPLKISWQNSMYLRVGLRVVGVLTICAAAAWASRAYFVPDDMKADVSQTCSQVGSSTTGTCIVAQTTDIAELPALPESSTAPNGWDLIEGLNAEVLQGSAVVGGQHILRLVAVGADRRHALGAGFGDLAPGGIYRATAWVKAEPGVRVMIEARDSFDPHTGKPSNYGVAQFDLAARSVVNSNGDIFASGVEAAVDDWVKVWVDLRSTDGQIFALIGLLEGPNNQHVFNAAGQSVIFGGFGISPPRVLKSLSQVGSPPPRTDTVTKVTTIGELPPLPESSNAPSEWDLIEGLNAGEVQGSAVISGQRILRLVAVGADGRHALGAGFGDLAPSGIYRAVAWVKAAPGVRVMIEARDSIELAYGRAVELRRCSVRSCCSFSPKFQRRHTRQRSGSSRR